MILPNSESLTAPVRTIKARVEVFNASTPLYVFNPEDKLIEFEISRLSEAGLFFGFGVCQSIQFKISDKNKEIDIPTKSIVKVSYLLDGQWVYPYPNFYTTQCRRDEITHELTGYGYDLIFDSSKKTYADLVLSAPYTIERVAFACADIMGTTLSLSSLGIDFDILYENGANYEGTETVREIMTDIAEATQTYYYINNENKLVFKRLNKEETPSLTITKNDYMDLDYNENKRLQTIVNVTELGENYSKSTEQSGSTQYVRENPFWNIDERTPQFVDAAINRMGNISIGQFDCKWRGNYLLEIGDKILIEGREEWITSFMLNDIVNYDGTFSSTMNWEYTDNDSADFTNPTNIGDVLKQTFAKVDKVNKTVTIVASEVNDFEEKIGQLEVKTDSIEASVSETQESIANSTESMREQIETLTKKVDLAVTSEDLQIKIENTLENDVYQVTTTTGYKFDKDGLSISKSDSVLSTKITEDGMTVLKNNETMLTANNQGVEAKNLHATTYLIIGNRSRFENYGSRTGCFWID